MTMLTAICCMDCGRASYHPDDVAHAYCGQCHTFGGPRIYWDVDSTCHGCVAVGERGLVYDVTVVVDYDQRIARAHYRPCEHVSLVTIRESVAG